MWSKRILPKICRTVCFSCDSVLLSNTIQEFLAGRLAGKRKMSPQTIVTVNSFDSRWGYSSKSRSSVFLQRLMHALEVCNESLCLAMAGLVVGDWEMD